MKGGKLNIPWLRRLSQVLFLILILYGGSLGITKAFGVDRTDQISEEDQAAAKLNENLERDQRFFLFLPSRACKDTSKTGGTFQGCGIYLATSVLVYKSFAAYAVTILFAVGLIFIFGRTWCGWACPMGLFQEMFGWVRSKMRINHLRLPRKAIRILRNIRWGWLSIVILVAFTVALPMFETIRKDLQNFNCNTCPTRFVYSIFPTFRTSFMTFETPYYGIAAVLMILFLVIFAMSFLVRRFWCRICPNGALLALSNRGCLTTKEKDIRKCTKCGICYRVCPMDNEDVYKIRDQKIVNSTNCVMCFECVHKCPETDCLQVKVAGKKLLKSSYK